MAITITDVQQASNNASAASITTTDFVTNPSTGNSIVVLVSGWNGGSAPSDDQISDTLGSSYVRIGTIVRDGGGNEYLTMFYAQNVDNSGNIIGNVTYVNPVTNPFTGFTAVAWLLSGVETVFFYNNDTTTNAPTVANVTTFTTGTSTGTPPANSIGIGGMTNNSTVGTAITDGSGWNTTGANGFTTAMASAARQVSNASSNQALFTEYKITSTGVAATWTEASTSDTYSARIATFAVAGAGVVIIPVRILRAGRAFPFRPGSSSRFR